MKTFCLSFVVSICAAVAAAQQAGVGTLQFGMSQEDVKKVMNGGGLRCSFSDVDIDANDKMCEALGSVSGLVQPEKVLLKFVGGELVEVQLVIGQALYSEYAEMSRRRLGDPARSAVAINYAATGEKIESQTLRWQNSHGVVFLEEMSLWADRPVARLTVRTAAWEAESERRREKHLEDRSRAMFP